MKFEIGDRVEYINGSVGHIERLVGSKGVVIRASSDNVCLLVRFDADASGGFDGQENLFEIQNFKKIEEVAEVTVDILELYKVDRHDLTALVKFLESKGARITYGS